MVMSLQQLIEAGYDIYIAYAILFLAVFGIIILIYFAIKFIIWLFKKDTKDAQQIIDESPEEKYEAEVKEDEPDRKSDAYTERMENLCLKSRGIKIDN